MKKITIAIMVAAGITSTPHLSAQSIAEGISHLYAGRDQSAKVVFEKLLATTPSNIEATYWLGQTYLEMENIEAARQLYDKTLSASGNAPLILVGRGHIDLIENKDNEARQRFETAITASRGKKGDDPAVLNGIGRASSDTKAKTADIAYGIEKLKTAAERDSKNADILLNLGDAYRKAHDGSNAVANYQKALALNPALARAQFRTAMIYYTQRNWEVYQENLNKTLAIDPKFAPAYYELYYYNLYRQKFTEAEEYAKKYIANTDADIQNEYLRAQTLYIKKDYDGAINIVKNILSQSGDKTKPKNYKLLAYSYVDKGDTASAKQYIDLFFEKATDEEVNPQAYILKGAIDGALTKDDNLILNSYKKAIEMDTIYENKRKTLQDAIDAYKAKGNKKMEAELRLLDYVIKKNPNPAELFSIGIPLYQSADYKRADSVFSIYSSALPDSLYGHFWRARANIALDTTFSEEPYLSNVINSFKKTLEISGAPNNKDRFKSQAVTASSFLAQIYNNTKKDKDSAIYFLQKGLEVEPASVSLSGILDALKKTPVKGSPKPSSGGGKPSSFKQSANMPKSLIAART